MHRRARLLAGLALAACAGPAPAPAPTPQPARTPPVAARDTVARAAPRPDTAPPPAPFPDDGTPLGPLMRVGLEDVPTLELGLAGPVQVRSPGGQLLALVPAGAGWRLVPGGTGVALLDGAGRRQLAEDRVSVVPEEGALVTVGAARYRGALEVLPTGTGLLPVNSVTLEEYLPGVVAAEIGNRTDAEREAVLAQAVVARTYALRNRGRWATRGYDLEAGTGDQVYRGTSAELPLAVEAVRATRGQVLTWDGEPIDAFFSSTCGGRTERGSAVFAAADRPYLPAQPDLDPAGRAWCADSPRYRWTERWTRAELEVALRTGLRAVGERPQEGPLRDLRVDRTSATGRVEALAIRYRSANVSVAGQNPVRRALPPPGGTLLRSARFTLHVEHHDGLVSAVRAEGGGAGHGVGLCQWGAIGRARAGHDHVAILAAYYPGTALVRWY